MIQKGRGFSFHELVMSLCKLNESSGGGLHSKSEKTSVFDVTLPWAIAATAPFDPLKCARMCPELRMEPNPQNKVSRFLLAADLVLSYKFYIEIIGEVDVINNV